MLAPFRSKPGELTELLEVRGITTPPPPALGPQSSGLTSRRPQLSIPWNNAMRRATDTEE